MKKCVLFVALALGLNSAFAYDYNPIFTNNQIKENQVINFCKSQNAWDTECADSLKFTKHYTSGSGGFSEYEINGKTYQPGTVLEFLTNGRIIGYNPYKLKFYYLAFKNDKFDLTELKEDEIKSLFPNVQIVKLSQFKNGEITLYKPFFRTKTFLFVNDTEEEFYKYQFEHYKNQRELIKGIFEPKTARTYVYSHFGSRNQLTPPLKIKVKNKIKN